jgi:hypothetical protein
MERRRFSKFAWAAAACALGIVLGSCTPGGQFDPTEMLSNDIFNTKKKIQGDREPLFPNGVPGAETGVPPDLMKGYQAPPEQAAAVETPSTAAKPVPAAEKPKPPKPKPKAAVARASPPAAPAPQPGNAAWPAPQQPAAPQTNWPSPSGGQSAPPAQTNWPAPPASAQTNWPSPPPPAGQAQQGTSSGQLNWPNPPAPTTSSH